MTGPLLVVALVVEEVELPAVPPAPFVAELAPAVVFALPESFLSLPLHPQASAMPRARVVAVARTLVVEPKVIAMFLARG